MKVKVLRCFRKEFEGKVVEVYSKCANGIDFVTKYGLVFVNNVDYEEVK